MLRQPLISAPSSKPHHVRWAVRRDLPRVVEIERRGAGGSSDPGEIERDYLALVKRRNVIGMVAEDGDVIAGHMVYVLERSRIVVERFAVHPEFRRAGAGRAMAEKLKGKVGDGRRTSVEILVEDDRDDLVFFLKAVGFLAVEVVRARDEEGRDLYRFVHRALRHASEKNEMSC